MSDAFYTRYVAACEVLSIPPLSRAELQVLIDALVEHSTAVLN
jgi:hypothetical protein